MASKAKVSKINQEERLEDNAEEAKKAFSALMDAYKRLDAAAKEVVDAKDNFNRKRGVFLSKVPDSLQMTMIEYAELKREG